MTLLVEDRELLAGFRAGHRQVLERVYRHYAPEIARFLRQSGFVYRSNQQTMSFVTVYSPFELESTLQEVFVRAFEPRARLAYDGLRPYRGFLIGIARNIVLDAVRRRARRGEIPFSEEMIVQTEAAAHATSQAGSPRWTVNGVDEPPEDTLDRRRGEALVKEFLDESCDDRDRELYALRYGRELAQEEVAQQAGLTRIQVRRWESKFRKRLLRHLKRAGYMR